MKSPSDGKLTNAMRNVAEAPVREGFEQELMQRVRHASHRSVARRVVLPVVGGVVAAVCTITVVVATAGHQTAPVATPGAMERDLPMPNFNGIDVVPPGTPCVAATHAPVETSAREANQEVWLPPSDSAYRVSDSWACSAGGSPVLLIDKIQVSYEPGWSDVGVLNKWADLQEEIGGEVLVLSGVPTLVHEATDDAPNNEIMFVEGDTLVRLLSVRQVPVDDMVKLAEAIAANTPRGAQAPR
jgi:hypothetical protein